MLSLGGKVFDLLPKGSRVRTLARRPFSPNRLEKSISPKSFIQDRKLNKNYAVKKYVGLRKLLGVPTFIIAEARIDYNVN